MLEILNLLQTSISNDLVLKLDENAKKTYGKEEITIFRKIQNSENIRYIVLKDFQSENVYYLLECVKSYLIKDTMDCYKPYRIYFENDGNLKKTEFGMLEECVISDFLQKTKDCKYKVYTTDSIDSLNLKDLDYIKNENEEILFELKNSKSVVVNNKPENPKLPQFVDYNTRIKILNRLKKQKKAV